MVGDVAALGQALAQVVGRLLIVFDDQDAHGGHGIRQPTVAMRQKRAPFPGAEERGPSGADPAEGSTPAPPPLGGGGVRATAFDVYAPLTRSLRSTATKR